MYIKELTNEEFLSFTSTFPYKSIYQTPEYAFVMNNEKATCFFIGLIDDTDIVGASLIIVEKKYGFKYAYIPRGFLINYNDYRLVEEFTLKIKEFLGEKDITALKINPMIIKNIYNKEKQVIYRNKHYDSIFEQLLKLNYKHCGYNDYFEAIKPRFESILNINLESEQIFKNIDKSYRTKIKNAILDGIHIYKGTNEELDILYNLIEKKYPRSFDFIKNIYKYYDNRSMVEFYYAKLDTAEYIKNCQKEYEEKEQELNEINYEIMETTKEDKTKLINKKIENDNILNQNKNKLIKATEFLKNYPEGILLASVMIIKYSDTIYLFIDGYNKEYKQLNAKHLLLWKIIEQYSNLGYKKFNLGGISNINQESKYSGLNNFKSNFGSCSIEYIGDFELITNNRLYFMYNQRLKLNNIIKKN